MEVVEVTKRRTRNSQKTKLTVDDQGSGIKIVSKNKAAKNGVDYDKLKEKFDKIEHLRIAKEKEISEREAQEKKMSRSNASRVTLITHINIFLYSTCYWIQSGTLPYLTKTLGADPVMFGHLQTVFSILQLLGGPVYGRIGDMYGERSALIIAFSSSVLTYLITFLSHSLPVLFISRIPSVFLHVMQGSQMVMTGMSSQEDRAAALARLGFSYGIGMVVGPTLGGQVTSHFGEHAAALLAAIGSTLSLILVIVFIPEFKKQEADKKAAILDLKKILGLLTLPRVGSLMLIKTVCGVPIGILQSMFSVIAMEQFNLAPDQNGMLMSYIGALSMLMQGVGISAFTSRFSDTTLLKFSAMSLVLCYYLLSLLSTMTDFLLLQIPLVCSLSLINSILQSSVTKVVPASSTGTMLGLNMAVHSVIRTLSPSVGALIMSTYGYSSIGYLGVVCNIVVLAMLKFFSL